MYIASVPNRNSPPAILLREGYRKNGKSKTRTIANFSHLPPERIEALRKAFRGDFDGVSGDWVCDRIHGVLFTLQQVAIRQGIVKAIGKGRMAQLMLFLVLARVAHHGSRLSAVRWAKEHAIPEILGLQPFDENDLYQALDFACTNQELIENRLYRKYVKEKGAAPTLILYDVTSSYLEGEHNELGEYGYNRDGKRGKKQIVIGLLAGSDGEPLAVKVFRGNTTDVQTVGEQIDTIKKRFGISEVVFVGDRGMVKSAGKKALGDTGLKYITALTDPQVRKLIKGGIIQVELFDETVCEVQCQSKRLILRRNSRVADKENRRRQDKLAKLTDKVRTRNAYVQSHSRALPESGLKQLQSWAKRHKLSGFVQLILDSDQLHMDIDQEAKQDDGLLDGCYVLETDVAKDKLNTDSVDARYRDLELVERDFRSMKTAFLEVRPIFVRTEEHTRGAVFIAMLGLKILREMQSKLVAHFGTTDDDLYAVTVENALGALGRLCFERLEIEGQSVLRLPLPDARQDEILQALQVSYPTTRTSEASAVARN
jgi:transposase